MILAFSHPGFVVPDLEKAIAFYRDMFGFQVIGEEGWEDSPEVDRAIGLKNSASKGCMMAGHNCYLELFEYRAPEQTAPAPDRYLAHETGIRHIAFYVDDVRKEFARLLSLGGSKLGDIVEGGTAVYARDPFGNIIELCEIPNEQENPTQLPGVNKLGDIVEGGTAVYARDPFGNIIELCEIPNEQENPTQLPGVNKLGEFGG